MAELFDFPLPPNTPPRDLRETLELVEAFLKIKDPHSRSALVQMAKRIAESSSDPVATVGRDLHGG